MTRAVAPASASTRARLAVPWPTVALLSVAMAFADGYWMISVRGAVGAVQRAQGPFSVWWRESALSLPFFALAVLFALIAAGRLFGPQLHRLRSVVGALLLVVAAGTLAGIAEITASSAYDYHLQSAQLRFMDSMHNVCVGSCLAQEQHATLDVHVQAVMFAARALLLTNIVLVGWVFALLGGRLRTGTRRSDPARSAWFRSRFEDLRIVVVTGLLGAAAVHAAVVPEHLSEWTAAGLFFVLLTAAESAAAGGLLLARRRGRATERTMLCGAAALCVGPIAVWLYSRTIGLPFGPVPNTVEAVGVPDVVAGLLELATLACVVVMLWAPHRLAQRDPTSPHLRGVTVLAIVAATVVGLALTEPGSAWLGDFGLPAMSMPHVAAP